MSHAWRWCLVRVKPASGPETRVLRPVSLWWLALAAAEETLEGGPLVRPWLRLFRSQLSRENTAWLRWAGDLGESAEIRRAYSALYGRYAARGMLQALFGFERFVSLRRNVTTLPHGIRITRNDKGDIPDWIAWDPAAGGYVLGEAKGNLTGRTSEFLFNEPACLKNGKDQFGRVDVTDAAGLPVTTSDWVGASLWSTDARPRQLPVFVAWDPAREGRTLSPQEAPQHREAASRRWLTQLALGFGHPELLRARIAGAILQEPPETVTVTVPSTPDAKPPAIRYRLREDLTRNDEADRPAKSPHTGRYIPLVMTVDGLVRLRGEGVTQRLSALQAQATKSRDPALFIGLNTSALKPAGQETPSPWISDYGLAAPSGLAVFDLRKIEIEPAEEGATG